MNSKKDIQKTSYSMVQLETEISQLKLVNEHPPCICISGLRNLALSNLVNHCNFKIIILSLFNLLNIPNEWVLDIKTPPHTLVNDKKIPFEVMVQLIDHNIKLKVYKILLNHLKHTRQKKIHLRIVN